MVSKRGPGTSYPDVTRLKRAIGLAPYRSGTHRIETVNRAMRYETALAVVHGLGLDPVDFGL